MNGEPFRQLQLNSANGYIKQLPQHYMLTPRAIFPQDRYGFVDSVADMTSRIILSCGSMQGLLSPQGRFRIGLANGRDLYGQLTRRRRHSVPIRRLIMTYQRKDTAKWVVLRRVPE